MLSSAFTRCSERSEIRLEEVTEEGGWVCETDVIYKCFVSQFIYSGQTGKNVEEFTLQVGLTIKLTWCDGDKMQ